METDKKNPVQIGMDSLKKAECLWYNDGDYALADLGRQFDGGRSVRLEMFMLVGCFEGRFSITLNGTRYEVDEGALLCCVPGMVLDAYAPSADVKGHVLCVSLNTRLDTFGKYPEIWRLLGRMHDCPLFRPDPQERGLFRQYGRLITRRLEDPSRPFGREVISSLLRTMIFEVLASFVGQQEASEDRQMRQQDILFQRFLGLFVSQGVKSRRVEWYSDQLCVSAKYLSAVCKQVSGKTAFYWVNQFVLADVRYQLKHTDRSLKEVADYLGFPNPSFFGKFVRRHEGCSPGELRQRLRHGKDVPTAPGGEDRPV